MHSCCNSCLYTYEEICYLEGCLTLPGTCYLFFSCLGVSYDTNVNVVFISICGDERAATYTCSVDFTCRFYCFSERFSAWFL